MRPSDDVLQQDTDVVVSSSPEGGNDEQRRPQATQLARLYRGAAANELSDSTRALLKDLLFSELGMTDTVESQQKQAPIAASDAQPIIKQVHDESPTLPQGRVAESKQQKAVPISSLGTAQLELKLRQMIDANAAWESMEPLALRLYASQPAPATAARVIELAFVHATTDRLEPLLQWAKKNAPGFYRHLHPTLRTHLVIRLWRSSSSDTLATLLFRDRDESFLQPIERLFLFQSMTSAKDPTVPYLYFNRYRNELLNAVMSMGGHVGLTASAFLLRVGQLALDLGYNDDAAQILDGIGANTPERDDALRLMLTSTVEKNKAGRSHLAELLMAEATGEGRLQLLQKFLAGSRGLGGFKDRNRPALNELLADPLSWLPMDVALWGKLSSLLTANRDLAALLPNLLAVFQNHALKFHAANLDIALWQGPLNISPVNLQDEYWRGIGLLHFYAGTGATAEAELWQALNSVKRAKEESPQPLPILWKELHRAAFTWVIKATHLLDGERTRMLRQLRVAVPLEQITAGDLTEYVEQAEGAPLPILRVLRGVAERLKEPVIAKRLLLKGAAASHLTNVDLNHVWQLGLTLNDHDLAWRAATVLNARQALVPAVRHAWEFSGEKRAEYGFFVPTKKQVQACLVGMSSPAARLANACLMVGGALPELLSLLDPGATVTRVSAAPHDSIEARVDQALSKLDWLLPPRRRYRFSFESALGGSQLPAFMQVLPTNAWSLLTARLAERLGINAWGWRLSRLHAQIADLIPRLASRQDLRRHSSRVATWLKELTPEQRAAWQDMAALSRALDDQTAAVALAGFVCRLATLICPNHYMALTSLQSMRAQTSIIWDMETWLLGESYSQSRASLGTVTRVPVPHSLQRLTSVVTLPESATMVHKVRN